MMFGALLDGGMGQAPPLPQPHPPPPLNKQTHIEN